MRRTQLDRGSDSDVLPGTQTSQEPEEQQPAVDALTAGGLVQLDRMLDEDPPGRKPPHWSYSSRLGLSNDNLPWANTLVPEGRRDQQDPRFADDDGLTFSASFDQTLTNDKAGVQIGTHSSYFMLTQDGSAEDRSLDRRADLMNNLLLFNRRFEAGSGVTFFAGVGIGTQTVGDIGGDKLQNWFHVNGGMGGRLLGHGLQDDYGNLTGTSITSPAASLGLRLDATTGQERKWNAGASLEANGLVGFGSEGMSAAQLGVTGKAGHGEIADVVAGLYFSAGRPNGEFLKFAPISDGQVGYQVGLQINILRKLGVEVCPTVMVQSNGGGFAETTYTIGFVIGGGALSWLKPPR